MNSVCFACGHEKEEPLVICDRCDIKPISRKDKISSMCLSINCLKDENLLKASRFIRAKHKLPKFGDKIIAKGTKLVDSLSDDDDDSQYTQIGVDESFFDFKGFADKRGEVIKVHAIGKPVKDPQRPNETTKISYLDSNKSTYQLLEWELGKDISFEDADTYADDQGEMYIQFFWMGDKGWTWKHVSKSKFEQIKTLDSMRG